ncbi:MAG: flavodoxin domain-containing protein [Blastococcus sp.]
MTVLVAYASRHGATHGVAERIAARLRAHGFDVHLDPLLGREDVRRFEAVVVGSPVYSGHWEDEAVAFVRRNAAALAGHPVWTFSVGWLAHHRGLLRKESWSDARGLAQLDQLLPAHEHRFFAGALSPAELRCCSAGPSGWPAAGTGTSATGPRSTPGPTGSPSIRRWWLTRRGEASPAGRAIAGHAQGGSSGDRNRRRSWPSPDRGRRARRGLDVHGRRGRRLRVRRRRPG